MLISSDIYFKTVFEWLCLAQQFASLTPYKLRFFEHRYFTRYCSDISQVWWDISIWFCCKFTTESVTERIWKSVNIWGSYGQEFSVLFFIDSRCRTAAALDCADFSPVASIPFAANISAVTVMREMIRYIMWTMISHTKPNNIQAYHIVVRATATAGLRVTMQKNSSNLDTGFPDQRMYSRIDTNTYRQTDRQTHGHASLNTSVPSRRRSNQNLGATTYLGDS